MVERAAGLPPKGTPKNYLMAWLLVTLNERDLHGYEILKELRGRFCVSTDAGTVYRALRGLEREGFISSWWDPQGERAARRVYTLTEEGHAALSLWSATFERYRSNLDAFFVVYAGGRRRPVA